MPNGDVVVTISQAWGWFIAACAAIITVVNAWKAIREVKAASPNSKQNDILDLHEKRLKIIEERLDRGDERFDKINSGEEVMLEALLALTSHAINGNDLDPLKEARDKLQKHLIQK